MPGLAGAPMSARKQEALSSSGAGSTFWRQSSSAIPGRVNLKTAPATTRGAGGGSGNGPAPSFQHFQDSVSDAWEIEESSPPPPVRSSALSSSNNASSTSAVQTHTPARKEKNCTENKSSITPVHVHTQAAAGRGGAPPATTTTPLPPPSSSSATTSARSHGPTHPPPPTSVQSPESETDRGRSGKFERLLAEPVVNMAELEQLSWSGVPGPLRSRVWKLLCGYLPAGGQSDQVLRRKRDEYGGYVNQYFNNKEEDIHKDTFRQISIDVPRMSPLVTLFQQKCVQEMVERILYIWAIRHPASGYVQGINDLVTPFLIVFLQEHVDQDVTRSHCQVDSLPEAVRFNIEADSFWCMTRVLDGIQDNYTFAQPGIQVKIRQLEELLKRVDLPLHNHIVGHEVQYLQFSFRWMNNLLLRELPLSATVRLWDTYLAERDGFSKFHLYVCAAFLIRWKADLEQKKDFQGILLFIQNVPTAKWNDRDISLLVAEAYKLKYMFADAPSHLTDCRVNRPLL